MPMVKENLLVTLADKNYIDQAKQLFSSVYWNAGWKGDYMLLAHEIPEKDLKWFRNKGIFIKKCKPLYDKKIGIGKYKYPPTVVDKFYLFTPEFKKWKHVIYLDADIIVRASLDKLTKVKGFASPRVLGLNQLIKYYFYLLNKNDLPLILKKNYNLNKPSFNSGIMAFSTNLIQDDMFKELIKLFRKYVKIAKGDDPILNIFFYKKWKRLPTVYDISPPYIIKELYIAPKKIKGIILHFVSKDYKDKPWNLKNPFYKEWKYNLDRAELIDFKNNFKKNKWTTFQVYRDSYSLRVRYKWNKSKIYIYSFYLKLKHYTYILFFNLEKLFTYLINLPERFLGKFGIFLKKHNIGLYNKLKNIEKKIRK